MRLFKKICHERCIVITSPGKLQNDIEKLNEICKWDILVVDEAHLAKNVNTNFWKSLKAFKATKQKVLLTGTPIQNNLEEFYSIMDIVKDGIFGGLS